ncbi:EAL domain-containing protein (putative c-di-GMP-specific phosphodiesterase class I) [Paenibacillus harenae]|uniref:EAL domain-containing protein (Putative c-di-GMP-specific phosphodiesterase class I) n=2 Tax=Paenibacillus harenae TaxID=306543 RepID=A0ABT9U5C2_PAEHA|nr:EAL domain-containing protein (putative c-di-GMP-specific phosphodiesterase class I) [Paenibacillus harenae]
MKRLRESQRMSQLGNGIWTMSGTQAGQPGLIGVLYMSWQQSGESEQSGSGMSFRKEWKQFAERETEAVFKSSVLFEGMDWIHDDLFIYMRLPSGRRGTLEGWLLETAFKHTKEWERRFAAHMQQLSEQHWSGKLYIGVAVAEISSSSEEGSAWYEAVKQAMLHGQSAGGMERSIKRRAFDRLMEQRSIDPVYQPILSLREDKVFGFEALTRTRERTWFEGPLELFSFAEQEGAAYVLDRLAREKAIEGCGGLRREQKLFINVMAQIIEDPEFSPGLTLSLLERRGLSPHNVVFEITERNSIEDFGAVKKALEHYRSQGYQIAIDDVGAGYSSLQSIVELRPDYLKVDRSIIQDIHQDEMKAHILHTLAQLAAKMDISIIAEGIEQEEELAKVRELGASYAQGYLLGRPAAMSEDRGI